MGLQKISFIGVLGNEEDNAVFYLIEEIFFNGGYHIIYENDDGKILFLKSKEDIQIGLMNITSETLEAINNLHLKFDLIVHTNLSGKWVENKYLKEFFSNISNIVIFNSDDNNSIELLKGNNKAVIITYGLNNKSTITASSLNIDNMVQFNYCIQRKIINFFGTVIDGLEFPAKLNFIEENSVYNGMASISTGIYYGIPIETIKKAIEKVKEVH
ncbi:MAG: hypothetical protein E7205_05685 [Tissierellaceae bacterium]|nr:hypothetical protein [Tissierellaceae bacterium]